MYYLYMFVLFLLLSLVSLSKENEVKIDKTKYSSVLQFEDYQHKIIKRSLSTLMENKTGVHEFDTYFTIDFENKEYFIDLTLNTELLPDNYAITNYSVNGKEEVYKPNLQEKNHCYYQGFVRGIKGSKVIANTCNGLKGCIILPGDFLLIQPLENGTHTVYRPEAIEHNIFQDFCESKNSIKKNSQTNFSGIFSEVIKFREVVLKQERDNEKQFVELMVVADAAAYNKYKTQQAVEDHIKEIANYVDGYYRELGIRVILSHIEVWNNGDLIPYATDAQTVLENLNTYRSQRLESDDSSSPWVYADTVHLLYGGDLDGSTLGIAYVGVMCRVDAVGVDQDNSKAMNAASTFSHELGHIFGMEHDAPECACPKDHECIMATSTSFSKPMAWSSCSQTALEQNLNLGLGSCLYNVPDPTHMVSGPQCGNDIVEQGEECDCGFPDQCSSKCCNPQSCMFVPGAVCDSGVCCSNCQIVSNGTLCRSAENECELPEFCTGESPHCPPNNYKEDGSFCLDGNAACNGGICLTHEVLCENTWGAGATSSDNICYTVLNVKGTASLGNCGRDENGNYTQCALKDIKCGKLFCKGGNEFPLVGTVAITLTIGNQYKCKTVGASEDQTEWLDPGLVRSGTTCGAGRICIDRACQNLPVSTCSQSCNGNGICNNVGKCHCNDGWSGLNCTQYVGTTSTKTKPNSASVDDQTSEETSTIPLDYSELSFPHNIIALFSTLTPSEVTLFGVSNMVTFIVTMSALVLSFKLYNRTCDLDGQKKSIDKMLRPRRSQRSKWYRR